MVEQTSTTSQRPAIFQGRERHQLKGATAEILGSDKPLEELLLRRRSRTTPPENEEANTEQAVGARIAGQAADRPRIEARGFTR